LPQTPLRELTAPPKSLAGFKGPTSKKMGEKGTEGRRKEGKEKGRDRKREKGVEVRVWEGSVVESRKS